MPDPCFWRFIIAAKLKMRSLKAAKIVEAQTDRQILLTLKISLVIYTIAKCRLLHRVE